MKTRIILLSPNSDKFNLNIRISWLRSVLRFYKLNKPFSGSWFWFKTNSPSQSFSGMPKLHSKKWKYTHCFVCGSGDHKMSVCPHKDSKKLIEVAQRRHYSTKKDRSSKNIRCVCKKKSETVPVDTRRRFNIYKTSIGGWQCRVDVL